MGFSLESHPLAGDRNWDWESLTAVRLAYHQPDDETMLRVVEQDAELREVR